MKRAIIFVLVGVLLAGCSAAQPSPIATATATLQPSATLQPTATKTLPPPTATATATPVPSPTDTPPPLFTQIYAFGDYLSDTGNGLQGARENVAQGKFEAETLKWMETYFMWEGRASNGPVAVEILAKRLNVGLTSYANGTATSGYFNDANEKVGLLSQIDQFESDLNGEKAKADSLYFIFASAYDLFPNAEEFNGDPTHDKKVATDRADQAVVNITDAVTRLAKLGARHFMVVNSVDQSIMPLIIEIGAVDKATAFQSRLKSELPGKMENLAKQLNVEIVIFDWLAASDGIRSNPEKYGLKEINKPCLVFTELTDAGTVICKSPNEYFFWCILDLTRRVHQIMGEAMAEQLSK